jgi:trimethylamine--corrinoid protein Co-methyltransferase
VKNYFDTSGGYVADDIYLPERQLSFEETIHEATLDILHKTGIKVLNTDAVALFHGAGATVEKFGNHCIVKMSHYLVEEYLPMAPENVTYHGRVAENDYIAPTGDTAFTTFGGCVKVIDPHTRKRRFARKDDLEKIIQICDYLDEIRIANRAVNATDVPIQALSVHNMEAILRNTGKHFVIGADSPASLRAMNELAAASVCSMENLVNAPIFSVSVCPVSPLVIPNNTASVIIEAAKLGIGIVVIPMALSGGTSAATLAGTLVSHNAEVLSCIVLAQIAKQGAACTYGSCSTILDLKYGTGAVGSPEYAKLNAAAAKLSHYYSLPSFVGGGCSDSNIPDQQSAYEFMLSATRTSLSGADMVWGCGGIEQGLTIDYAKLIMDAEMVRMILNASMDIATDEEALALDIIHNVGPGGTFLTHQHTLNHMRDQSRNGLFNRRNLEDWHEKCAGASLLDKAYAKAQDILESHQSPELPIGAQAAMDEIVREFDRSLRDNRFQPA